MMCIRLKFCLILATACVVDSICSGQEDHDCLREFQFRAAELNQADWIHWGDQSGKFSTWTNHSNRLIPVYSFGLSLECVKGENSCYRDKERLTELYGQLPTSTVNPKATYFDQADIYHLQKQAWESGKKHVILMVFDGMDWQTSQAASIYKNKEVLYTEGRGKGLAFQDYETGVTDFGFCVTSPHNGATKFDVDAQVVTAKCVERGGGYSVEFGGASPWDQPGDPSYLLGKRKSEPHPFADSASSGTSLNTGKKTYNGAVNINPDGELLETLAHQMQREGFAIGVVTNVPISHATPACIYAHNVHRSDFQDLTRDLLGLRSASHRDDPLPGVDVLIGCGWGETNPFDWLQQGHNFIPGNSYLCDDDLNRIDCNNGGKYVVVSRSAGKSGKKILATAAELAVTKNKRLLGFFGTLGGHLPYQTADGKFDPTRGVQRVDFYQPQEIIENPTLAEMTESALEVLKENDKGFFLMVEAGDVDWANHNNNIDDSIGAVFSGEEAFTTITNWVEENSDWDETCLIVTADHGHMLVLDDPEVLMGKRKLEDRAVFENRRLAKRAADAEQRRLEEAKQRANALKKVKELEKTKALEKTEALEKAKAVQEVEVKKTEPAKS